MVGALRRSSCSRRRRVAAAARCGSSAAAAPGGAGSRRGGELLLIGGAAGRDRRRSCFAVDADARAGAVRRRLPAAGCSASAGVTYDQRNAVVVGFALGFAVIPIIFTLAEDAFSNVPPSLDLGLAGARRDALAGGAHGRDPGRQPGPVRGGDDRPRPRRRRDDDRADGDRQHADAVARRRSTACGRCRRASRSSCRRRPYGGTLYRVLILTALLLFAMTFVLNTAAVMVAARLRKRFGRLAA